MNYEKMKSDMKNVLKGGAQYGRGDGISFSMYGSGKGGPKKYIHDVIDFLNGKKSIKPSKVAKTIGKIFKITSSIASRSEKYKGTASTLNNFGNKLDKIGDVAQQTGRGMHGGLMFGQGYGKKTIMIQDGSGPKRKPIKRAVDNFIQFLNGHKKIKPSGLIKIGSVIAGVVGAGAIAIGQPEVGAPMLAAAGALKGQSKELRQEGKGLEPGGGANGLIFGSGLKPGGSGRNLEGHHEVRGSGRKQLKKRVAKIEQRQAKKYSKKPGGIFGGPRVKRAQIRESYLDCIDRLKKQGYKSSGARMQCRKGVQRGLTVAKKYDPGRKILQLGIKSGSGIKKPSMACIMCAKKKCKSCTKGSGLAPGGRPKTYTATYGTEFIRKRGRPRLT